MKLLKQIAAVLGFFLLPIVGYAAYGGITWGYDSAASTPKLSVVINGVWYEVAFLSGGSFVSSSAPFVNDNAELKDVSLADKSAGYTIYRRGFYSKGDGGQGDYHLSLSACSAADDGLQVSPTSGTGCWIREVETSYRAEVFGAKGDNSTNDTAAIQKCVSALSCDLAAGKQYLITHIDIPSKLVFRGIPTNALSSTTNGGARIKCTSAVEATCIYGDRAVASTANFSNITLQGLTIEANTGTAYTWLIDILDPLYVDMDNLNLRNTYATGGAIRAQASGSFPSEHYILKLRNSFIICLHDGTAYCISSNISDSRYLDNYINGGGGVFYNGYGGLFRGNQFENVNDAAYCLTISKVNSAQNAVISNNYFDLCSAGGVLVTTEDDATANPSFFITITGNHFRSLRAGNATPIALGNIIFYNPDYGSITYVGGVVSGNINGLVDIPMVFVTGDLATKDNSVWSRISGTDTNSSSYDTEALKGTYSPTVTFTTPGDLDVGSPTTSGSWQIVDGMLFVNFRYETTFTFTTSAGNLVINLPKASHASYANHRFTCTVEGITKAGYTQFNMRMGQGLSTANIEAAGSGSAVSLVTAADFTTGQPVKFNCSGFYPIVWP
jgi:hypothetical protein